MKNTNHMITSMDAKKTVDQKKKKKSPFMIETLKRFCIEETYFNIIQAKYEKPTANVIFKSE